MTYLDDLGMTPEVIDDYLDRRLIRRQFSPDKTKVIYNYTESCQTGRMWDGVTLQCRGLIADATTGLVLARPFRKFFNYGEETGGKSKYPKDRRVSVTDKLDGSLGILYPTGEVNPDGSPIFNIASRGSFDSEQARHATQVWLTGYQDKVKIPEDLTLLFEIIYPENRIVVNYHGRDDIVLIGAVDINTGKTFGPNHPSLDFWWGLRTETFDYWTFREALAAPPRPNAEGLVVHFWETDERLKLKQEDYVALHKVVTGLNEQVVWEYTKEDRVNELLDSIPDELHDWVREVSDRLYEEWTVKHYAVLDMYHAADDNPNNITRKDYALWFKDWAEPWMMPALFHRLDERFDALKDVLWNVVKPSKEK